MRRMILAVAMSAFGLASTLAAETDPQAADEALIRQAVQAYVTAFNQGDAKALASLWSPEAVYTNRDSGEQVVGREAIEKQFSDIFAENKSMKLEAKTETIQFVSPNVALEHGTAKVLRPDQEPEDSNYTAVYVKRDGKWLLDRVTEDAAPVVSTHHEQLKQLEWMIGTWVDQDDQSRVETTSSWTKKQNFITRAFTLSIRDRIDLSGMQIIGWDPAAGQIRSWVFDSDGGFGEAVWTRKGDAWYVQSTGTLPDGSKSSFVNIITYVNENTCTWQSVNRVSGGELLPNIDEVLVVRQTGAQ